MKTKDAYREHFRREHRRFGLFLLTRAWKQGVDCIVVDRSHLEHHFGVTRVERIRIDWMKEDLESLFPFSAPFFATKGGKFQNLFLSRVPLPTELTRARMTVERRVKALGDQGVRTGLLPRLGHEGSLTAGEVLPYLAAVVHGLQPA